MKSESIEIKGKAYKIGFSFKAIREYELLAKKSITECTGTWDNIIFFYATISALNPDFDLSFDAFVNVLDEDPQLLIQFQTSDSQQQVPQDDQQNQKKSLFGLWMLSLLLLGLPIFLPITSGILFLWLSLRLLVKLIARIGRKQG